LVFESAADIKKFLNHSNFVGCGDVFIKVIDCFFTFGSFLDETMMLSFGGKHDKCKHNKCHKHSHSFYAWSLKVTLVLGCYGR
jgi:hypothetical protein